MSYDEDRIELIKLLSENKRLKECACIGCLSGSGMSKLHTCQDGWIKDENIKLKEENTELSEKVADLERNLETSQNRHNIMDIANEPIEPGYDTVTECKVCGCDTLCLDKDQVQFCHCCVSDSHAAKIVKLEEEIKQLEEYMDALTTDKMEAENKWVGFENESIRLSKALESWKSDTSSSYNRGIRATRYADRHFHKEIRNLLNRISKGSTHHGACSMNSPGKYTCNELCSVYIIDAWLGLFEEKNG